MTSTIAITYIGHRPVYKDGACGSGVTFEQGQTLAIPERYAIQMLKHPSVYVQASGKDAKSAVVADVPTTEEADAKAKEFHDQQDMRDTIARMDKESLKAFAQTHWRIALDGRKSAESLRAEVAQHFDQYGVA